MHPLPHKYRVKASSEASGQVLTQRPGLESIQVEPPVEFDGSGDCWSPEELFAASIVDCFILSFQAVAKAMQFSWLDLKCEITATLDKVDRQMQFTHYLLQAELKVSSEEAAKIAGRVLEKAEKTCLVSNSLKTPCELVYQVSVNTSSAD